MCGLWLNTNLSKISSDSIQHDKLPRYKWEWTKVWAGTGDNPGMNNTKKR